MSNDGRNEKRTEPTRGLLQGGDYVHSTRTDIRKRFEAIRAAQVPPALNVKTHQHEEEGMNTLYRVVARSLTTGAMRVMQSDLTEENAEAVVLLAVMRRGVEEECFYCEKQTDDGAPS